MNEMEWELVAAVVTLSMAELICRVDTTHRL